MKNNTTTTTVNSWDFSADSVTVNGRTFEAKYSVSRSGDVFVFATVCGAPIRVHVGTNMPMHASALAAAKAEPAPAPVQEAPKPAPVRKAVNAKAAKSEPAPAPVADLAPAPVQEAPKPAPVRKAVNAKAAKSEPAPAPVADLAPAPVQEAPKPAPVEKTWIGTKITGKGWNIAFDAETGRTRVLFQDKPTDAQKAAIEKAGFFWSNALNSWNRKLTFKAYRAAQELATTLNAIA